MKFFNKKAFTLGELITSFIIIWVLVAIIFVFVTSSVENIANNAVKNNSIGLWLNFQKTLQDFVDSWYSEKEIVSISGNNSVLYLKKPDLSAWVLVWVIDSDTKKIQKNYVYWDNFIGYRELSQNEVSEIEWDNNLVFDKVFQEDKVFLNLRIKDFVLDAYNDGLLVNMYVSVVGKFEEYYWKDFSDLEISNIYEYSLVL